MATMVASSSLPVEKKHWWLTNKKIVDKCLREARALFATQELSNVSAAVGLLDGVLAVSPRQEEALELKARSLLFLRRFREVADMLQDYIPSYKMTGPGSSCDGESSNSLGSATLSRERAKLLSPSRERSSSDDGGGSFLCFSVADLKRRVLAGLSKNSGREGHWRYSVLGEACSHLGLMEDAMVLLQASRRLASDAFRRESVCWSDDSYGASATARPLASESAGQLLSSIKQLLRKRAAAVAALDAGLHAEAIRLFSKVLDNRRSIPSAFAVGCLVSRAAAFRAAGRLAEAIADCNRALAIDTSSIPVLRTRADLLESVGALGECLRDLDHLKLLYDAILRDRKLPGPPWRQHSDVRYRDVPANLRALTARIQQLRCHVQAGEGYNVDYYALIGVRRGCTRSELDRAHLLLTLKHKPEKAAAFMERLEFTDDYRDLDAIRDQAKMSALILYRMLQKGYSSIMSAILDEEAGERQRRKEAAAVAAVSWQSSEVKTTAISDSDKPKVEMKFVAQEHNLESEKPTMTVAATATIQAVVTESDHPKEVDMNLSSKECNLEAEKAAVAAAAAAAAAASVFQGVFCRDMAVVGSMLVHRAIPVKYEALTC